MACACAGIVIGCVTLTGLGIVFTQVVHRRWRRTALLLALVLTAIAGIVLGMGMPTTPAYIVMVVAAGAGDDQARRRSTPAAHMFAFYFAILSAITPPVALAVFAAAGLAKADLWATGWAAMQDRRRRLHRAVHVRLRAGAADDRRLADDHLALRRLAASASCCLAAGLHGYFLRRASLWERAVLIAAAFCLVKPGWVTDLAGVALCAVVVAVQWSGRDKRRLARRCKACRRRADRVRHAAEDPSRAGTPPLLRG